MWYASCRDCWAPSEAEPRKNTKKNTFNPVAVLIFKTMYSIYYMYVICILPIAFASYCINVPDGSRWYLHKFKQVDKMVGSPNYRPLCVVAKKHLKLLTTVVHFHQNLQTIMQHQMVDSVQTRRTKQISKLQIKMHKLHLGEISKLRNFQ